MSDYTPEVWVMLEIKTPEVTLYKILAGWYGGFAGGDSWKLNSGCKSVEVDGDFFLFHGHSGSVYRCHKEAYRTSGMTASILDSFQYQASQSEQDVTIEIMPEDTNWFDIEYGE